MHREPLPINYDELPATLADPAATFTPSLFEGKLRGCCGTLEAVRQPQQFLAALKTKCGLASDYWSDRLECRRYRTTSYAD